MDKLKIDELALVWLDAKQAETESVQYRRQIEDELTALLNIDSKSEGTINVEGHEYKVKILNRMTRKVDTDLLQEIAAEHGMSNHLTELFRWKADLDMKAWKAASPEITSVLLQAVTTTAGRPSFSITKEEI
jgi:hypothetical protein